MIAMAWWNSLSAEQKIKISPRNPDALTGREIEIIWHQKKDGACSKCGAVLFKHNISMCDTCEGNSIISLITKMANERRKKHEKPPEKEA
jgi:hypothetical protein